MPQALLIARDMQNQLRRIPAGLRAWMPLSHKSSTTVGDTTKAMTSHPQKLKTVSA